MEKIEHYVVFLGFPSATGLSLCATTRMCCGIAHPEAELNEIAYASFRTFVAYFPRHILRNSLYQYTTYAIPLHKLQSLCAICTKQQQMRVIADTIVAEETVVHGNWKPYYFLNTFIIYLLKFTYRIDSFIGAIYHGTQFV